jgi:hypothetical protein
MKKNDDSKQIRKYKLQVFSSIAVGTFLLLGVAWELLFPHNANGGTRMWLAWLVGCFGAISVILGLKNLIRFSRGEERFVIKRAVSLNEGEIVIEDCPPFCELWIFCDVPFFYLNGTVQIEWNSHAESRTINVPRHRSWSMWWWRPGLYGPPIVWRSQISRSNIPDSFHIKFSLKPSFADTVYSELIPIHDVELVTVLVKSIK